jgi:4-aminobutyrate aminotransferase-like enzyme
MEFVVGEAFRQDLVIEPCGAQRRVLKVLPPLNISDNALEEGLGIIECPMRSLRGRSNEGIRRSC